MFANEKDLTGALRSVKNEVQKDLVAGLKGLWSKVNLVGAAKEFWASGTPEQRKKVTEGAWALLELGAKKAIEANAKS